MSTVGINPGHEENFQWCTLRPLVKESYIVWPGSGLCSFNNRKKRQGFRHDLIRYDYDYVVLSVG
jgi:hypothetical protein